MKHLAWFLLLAAACRVQAQDPAVTDADKYTVRIENDRVRVLEYHDRPGEKTILHHHPDFVLYALGPFKRRLTFPDGKTVSREFKAGDVIFMKAQDHIGENVGDTETRVIIVEMK
jgi:quercetin dioxygenase-like cupin family protein